MSASWRAHVTALLVLLHVIAVVVPAFPGPPKAAARSDLASGWQHRRIASWGAGLNRLGIPISDDALVDFVWRGGNAIVATRSLLSAPFEPYYRYVGTRQRWRMFSSVETHPRRFTVEIDRGRGWEILFSMGREKYSWRRETFEQERVRAVLSDFEFSPRKSYLGFARRVSSWALADFPDATAVRCRLIQRTTPLPAAQDLPERDFQIMTFDRAGTETGPTDAPT